MQNIKLSPLAIKLFLLLLILPIFYFSFQIYQKNTFSTHFVDEDDNFVTGSFLLRNEKLYKDLFSQHQPLTFILSVGIQKFSNPNSIYLLVKRHHDLLIFWAFLWYVFFVFRFGVVTLPFAIVFEISKIYLLGNLFLAESIVIYPLIYITFVILDNKIYSSIENFFWGLCFSFIFLQLLPLWPLLLFLLCLLLFNQKKCMFKSLVFVLLGVSIFSILCLKFLSIPGYIYQVFYINFKYYIPGQTDSVIRSLFNSLTTPLASFFVNTVNETVILERAASLLLVFGLFLLLKLGKIRQVVLVVCILALSNIRYVGPGKQYYEGFHLLPWFSLLLSMSAYILVGLLEQIKSIILKVIIVLGLVAFVVFSWFNFDPKLLLRDPGRDYYINFSKQFDIGQAVLILSKSDDKLFILPAQSLIYWQAKIGHISSSIFYYSWMDKVPEINISLAKLFENEYPTFFYKDSISSGNIFDVDYQYFYSIFDLSKYAEVYKDGIKIGLFVLRSRIPELSIKQLDELDYYRFTVN